MRILYLHQYFNSPEMVGGTRSYEMARRLVASGHQVEMVTATRHKQSDEDDLPEEVDGITMHWIPVEYSNEMKFGRRILAFLIFAFKSLVVCRNIKADLVFATSTPLTIAIPAVAVSKLKKRPFVFEVRDLWPQLPIAIGAINNPIVIWASRLLERFAYLNADRIIALSPGMKDGIRDVGYPGEKIEVIPNGCDTELFSRGGDSCQATLSPRLDSGRKLVVYAGTMGKINGTGYVVLMAEHALSKGFGLDFAIVGDGAERDEVLALAAQKGVRNKNFFYHRPVSKLQMPGVLAQAEMSLSLFVDLEEMWANSANKFFDSMASATPVAINYGGWQADLVREHGLGVVLPANDAGLACEAIAEFFSCQSDVLHAGHNCLALAKSTFDRNLLYKKFERTLLAAVADSGVHYRES